MKNSKVIGCWNLKNGSKTSWFNERVKVLTKEKKQTILTYKREKLQSTWEEYIRRQNWVNQEIGTPKENTVEC